MGEDDTAATAASDAAMDRTQEAMADLFEAPHPSLSAAAVAVLGAVFGLILTPASLRSALTVGLGLLAAPALLGAVVEYGVLRAAGGAAYLRRSMLLAVVGTGIGVAVAAVAWLARPVLPVPAALVVVLATSAPIWIRLQAVSATGHHDARLAYPLAVLPYGLTLLVLPTLLVPTPATWALAAALLVVFVLAGAAVVETMRGFAEDDFDANLLELHRAALEHVALGGDAGRDVLEDLFASQAVTSTVDVGVACFEGEDGVEAALVVPGAHPGPFGTLGGADLPARIVDALDVPGVVLHGACTHDLNPVTEADARRVVDEAAELVDVAEPEPGARGPARIPGDVLVQPLGDGVLAVHAPSPDRWDDVDAATGAFAEQAALDAGAEQVVFADAHHCAEGGTASVRYPMPRVDEIVDATGQATAKALDGPEQDLAVGLATRTGFDVDEGVGPAGVRCLVVEAGDHRTAYVVFDGNNAVPGLREAVREAALEVVDEAEVLTSDTHYVNLGLDGHNPVGRSVGAPRWQDLARELVDEAVADLAPVEAGFAKGEVDVDVFGAGTADRIAALIHDSTATARRLMVVTWIASLALGAAATVIAAGIGA